MVNKINAEQVPEEVARALDRLVDSGELWTSKDGIAAALNAWPGVTSYVNVEGERVMVFPIKEKPDGE